MKRHRPSARLAAPALAGALLLSSLPLAGQPPAASPSRDERRAPGVTEARYAGGAHAEHELVDASGVRRADALVGLQVTSRDDQALGEIADLVLQLDAPARVSHFLIRSGGDDAAQLRAAPIEAVTHRPDGVRLELTRERFDALPAVPATEAAQLLADAALLRRTQAVFNESTTGTVLEGDWRRVTKDQPAPRATNVLPADSGSALPAVTANEDRTRPVREIELEVAMDEITDASTTFAGMLYSQLNDTPTRGRDGQPLGSASGIWLTVDDGRIVLIELQSQRNQTARVGIGARLYQGTNEQGQRTFNVTREQIGDAASINDLEALSTAPDLATQVVRLERGLVEAGDELQTVAE